MSSSLAGLGLAGLFGAVEGVLIYFARPAYQRGVEWPITTLGIVAAIVLAVGLLPPYWELYKRGGRVVGISMFAIISHTVYRTDVVALDFVFLSIDFAGALFSLLSLGKRSTHALRVPPLTACSRSTNF